MIEALWLLLPVAAASGWLSARRGGAEESRRAADQPSDYYQGISFLLEREEDKAIDVFLRAVEVDDDTAETHLALGSLFRQRGEVQRAIRLHKGIGERIDLRKKLRDEARLELARDYFASGLHDWAERIYRQLIEERVFVGPCYDGLIAVHERGREWRAAIDAAIRSQSLTGADHGARIAQYHCEIAERSVAEGEPGAAGAQLERALGADSSCVRALMLRARLAAESGQHRAAVADYERALRLDEAIVPELAPALLAALDASGDEGALRAYLQRLRGGSHGYSMVRSASGLIERLEDTRSARAFFREQLLRRPSLQGLRHWARMEMAQAGEGSREQIAVIVEMLDRVLENRPSHHCRHCNFKGRKLHWQCPGCHRWDSIRAVLGAEGE